MFELKYRVDVKEFEKLKGKIEIPRFQRGLVWNAKKKDEFIKALKAGLPIGALLLSKNDDRYKVIDGLQRFSTMIDYDRNPFKYIQKEEITDAAIISVIYTSATARRNYDEYREEAKRKTIEEMREIISDHISRGQGLNANQISTNATREICSRIAIMPREEMFDIQPSVYTLVSEVLEKSKIDNVPIPLIIFEGSEEELATIFQKVNQEGVRLSKYDVFAATWSDHFLEVKDDPAFIEHVINKYAEAEANSDLEFADFDPEELKLTGKLTVFEYAFALGKAMMAKCTRLFPKMNDTKVDSIGFLILAELMGLTYQSMGALAQEVDKYVENDFDFKKLKDAIVDVCAMVENALVPYIDSPTKPKRGKRASLVCHSELQLASYIIVLFKLKYDLSPENGLVPRSGSSRDVERVKKFLWKHYLYDILRGFWSGSGDSKLESIIADPWTCRYVKDVDRDDFEKEISNWLKAANKKARQTNVTTETKLFLNYLLREKIPTAERDSYDVEHCVPKDVVKKYYIDHDIIVPMSSVCNLAYIPTTDNRSKGEQTYYQRQDSAPTTFTLNQEELDKLVYPLRADLRFVESTDKLTEENYFKFLDERRQVLVNEMMGVLYRA